jgi:APA family basic amino acid/polyamine antiporter
MFGLPIDTWIRFAVWLAIGLAIYFAYGSRRSRLATIG